MLRIELIGNLGSNAIIRDANCSRFLSFNVAHSVKRGDVETTTWVGCTMSFVPERLLPYLVKGQCVYVTGAVALRTYKGRDGLIHAGVDCRVDSVQLVDGRPSTPDAQTNGSSSAVAPSAGPAVAAAAQTTAPAMVDPFANQPAEVLPFD